MGENVGYEESSEFVRRAEEAVTKSRILAKEVFQLIRPKRSDLLGALSAANVLSRHRVGDEARPSNRYRFSGFSGQIAITDNVKS